ncbi:hypothetical protein KCA24_31195, partial [Escherichia coli]|nr:hypothetical protein [Escherichia coli]
GEEQFNRGAPIMIKNTPATAEDIRRIRSVLVSGKVNIKCHAKKRVNAKKQPVRCSPEVTKRVVALSLFDFFGCNHLLSR